MRSFVTTAHGTLTVQASYPRPGSDTRFAPHVTLASDEGWHTFTCSLSPAEARELADALQLRANEAEGR